MADPETSEMLGYAGFWRQVWSGSLDIVFTMLTFIVLVIIFMALASQFNSSAFSTDTLLAEISESFNFILFPYYFLYRTLCISSKHKASYGMRALNIQVTDCKGQKVSFLRACLRELLSYVSMVAFWIGYLIIPFTAKKQGFHDILSGCLVLKRVSIAFTSR